MERPQQVVNLTCKPSGALWNGSDVPKMEAGMRKQTRLLCGTAIWQVRRSSKEDTQPPNLRLPNMHKQHKLPVGTSSWTLASECKLMCWAVHSGTTRDCMRGSRLRNS
eukprot:6464839-Amphidinium_carterae.1